MKNGRAFAPLFLLLLTTFAVLLTALFQANIPQKASDPLSLQRPLNRWRLPGDAMVQADLSHERSTLHLNTHAPNRQGRYMRLTNHALAFVPGQRYTLTFRGRSELPRRVIIGVQWTLDGTPRRQESENVVVLGGEWRTYRHTFIAQRSWGNAYFELGRTYGTIDLDSVMIEAGAPDAIALVRTALHDNPLLLSLLLTLPIASALLYRRSLAERRILLPSLAMLCFLVDYLLWRISITRWSTPWLGLPILLADILSNVPLIALILLFWPRKEPHRHTNTPTIDPHTLPVCLFVPTVNEGVEVLEATLKGALVAQAHYQNTYPESSVRIVLCNDGKVAGYAYWETVEQLAKRLGVDCVTRTVPGGAKAVISKTLGQSWESQARA